MPTYVQGPDSDTWHWCKNCTHYPKTIAKQETHSGTDRPRSGELDNECRSLERDGRCNT